VAGSDVDTVNRQTFQVAYDSAVPNVPVTAATHEMDVQSLGPALMSFGRLIREANTVINGKKSTVKVLVQSDFEHKCFNITFDVVQNVLHQIATFITGDDVKNAKEILEDLGIILGTPGLGLLGYLKWKNKREVSEVRDSDTRGIVVVQLGDGNIATVNRNAISLSKNVKIRNAVEGTLKPIGVDGIDTIDFRDGTGHVVYGKEDATTIVTSFDIPEEAKVLEDADEGDVVVAYLRVHELAFDDKAGRGRFLYEGRPITVDISATNIAAQAVRRRLVALNDLYKVRMSVTPRTTPGGKEHFDYKILEVIEFTPAPQQRSLPL
jgi:hypothetical protein